MRLGRKLLAWRSLHAFALASAGVGTGMGRDIGLLVLDIDGTIAGDSNEVSEPVLNAIEAVKSKGIRVAIATGRMYQSAERFYRKIDSDMPLAAYQGALLKDPRDGRVHHHHHLPLEMARTLLAQLEQHSLDAIHLYIDDELYIRQANPLSDWYAERSRVRLNYLANLDTDSLTAPPTKILGMTRNTEKIDELLAQMRDRFSPTELYLTKSVPTFFEAAHPGVNKGIAVKYMAEDLLGLQAERVMVVGDSHNDIEMLGYAGTAVAMGNAPADVQAHANWVAPAIERDGVAAAIEEFLL
ncbi:Cof-type HAD-IIB family hydrolase [Synechococcus sp. PCC 7336]|uniref:Cof-type HAD-IIB family hydrolase n=1 Tax=Synechococcus sp. PCC 7336 TaxID=195250 RepID=UPI001D0D2683|nr:Cof-type HAD-IIB family hydrolase [Synechococcus sp. PCC 7336]